MMSLKGEYGPMRERECVKIMITRLKSKKFKIVKEILGPHVMESVRIIEK
jgi:hypothetical protein